LSWQPQKDRRVLNLFDPLEGRPDWPERKFAAGARVGMVGEKAVGVMEPGGHFALYSLPDGRTIADLELEAEPSLRDITLLESAGKYFLLTSDSAPDDVVQQPGFPIGGGLRGPGSFQIGGDQSRLQSVSPSKPVGTGRLYAFDGHGKLLWPVPVKIEDQRIVLNQPADLTFACRVRDEEQSGRYKTSVLCIDKRNGRTAYQAEDYQNNPEDFFQIVGDAKKKTVDLRDWTNTITLTFTDKPWPLSSGTKGATAK
jgi:hypothetical protein